MLNHKNSTTTPTLMISGASGIVGRHFIDSIKNMFTIYAIARRSINESQIHPHPNINWIQADIANFSLLKAIVINTLKKKNQSNQIDFVLHLASYYDFNCTNHPEYQRTNIDGTHHLLELSKSLQVKRFIFTSSLAAVKFPPKGKTINEQTPLEATHPYAISKKSGEILVKEYSKYFPCSIVRPAAVFTDWCEYGILYMQLSRWFSKKIGSRILEGKGELGIPYIHSDDLNQLFIKIFEKSNQLPDFDVYIASPDGATTHKELYETAAKFFFGEKIKPFFAPRSITALIVIIKDFLGRLLCHRPFERPWMLKYIDRQLLVDSSQTRKMLDWEPTPRCHILRRLLYLVEKMKTYPEEWHYINTKAMKRIPQRPNLLIYEIMVNIKQEVLEKLKETLLNPKRKKEFLHYQMINRENFNWDVDVFYQLLTASVRNKDRMLLINYAQEILIPLRFNEGFPAEEVCTAILEAGKIVIYRLLAEIKLKGMKELIHDYIFLTLQLTVDEVEVGFEKLNHDASIIKKPQRSDIEEKLKELATFCIQDNIYHH